MRVCCLVASAGLSLLLSPPSSFVRKGMRTGAVSVRFSPSLSSPSPPAPTPPARPTRTRTKADPCLRSTASACLPACLPACPLPLLVAMITLKLRSANGAPQTGKKSQDCTSVNTQGYPTPESCRISCRGISSPPTTGKARDGGRRQMERGKEKSERGERNSWGQENLAFPPQAPRGTPVNECIAACARRRRRRTQILTAKRTNQRRRLVF